MNKPYYFYRKTIEPDTCEFYDHSKGIVGYTERQLDKQFYHGTIKELDEHLSFKRPAKVGVKGARSWN